jgi:hypothetical protein
MMMIIMPVIMPLTVTVCFFASVLLRVSLSLAASGYPRAYRQCVFLCF